MQPLRVNLPAAPVAVRVLPGPGGEPASGVLAEADGPESLEAERSALARACGALEQAAKRLHALGQEIRAEAEDHLLDLAVDIARKVIAGEIRDGMHVVVDFKDGQLTFEPVLQAEPVETTG